MHEILFWEKCMYKCINFNFLLKCIYECTIFFFEKCIYEWFFFVCEHALKLFSFSAYCLNAWTNAWWLIFIFACMIMHKWIHEIFFCNFQMIFNVCTNIFFWKFFFFNDFQCFKQYILRIFSKIFNVSKSMYKKICNDFFFVSKSMYKGFSMIFFFCFKRYVQRIFNVFFLFHKVCIKDFQWFFSSKICTEILKENLCTNSCKVICFL